MKTAKNIGNRPGPQPGCGNAVNEHKAIAMGMTAPASKRETKPVGMKGSSNGACKIIGLSNR